LPANTMDLTAGKPAPAFDRARRSAQTEILDGPVDTGELAKVLRDLARFNGAMMGHWPVIQWLNHAVGTVPKDMPLGLVDVGCGYGDLLRTVRRWARKRAAPSLSIRNIRFSLKKDPARFRVSSLRPAGFSNEMIESGGRNAELRSVSIFVRTSYSDDLVLQTSRTCMRSWIFEG